MADIKTEFFFQTTLTQKEFSLITRCLANHELKTDEEAAALELNKKLLDLRLKQVKEYAVASARALEVAEAESAGLPIPENNPRKLRNEVLTIPDQTSGRVG